VASKLFPRYLDTEDRKLQGHARGITVGHRIRLAVLGDLQRPDYSPLARHICFYGEIRPPLLQLDHQLLEVPIIETRTERGIVRHIGEPIIADHSFDIQPAAANHDDGNGAIGKW
jgi:hypothetical protein